MASSEAVVMEEVEQQALSELLELHACDSVGQGDAIGLNGLNSQLRVHPLDAHPIVLSTCQQVDVLWEPFGSVQLQTAKHPCSQALMVTQSPMVQHAYVNHWTLLSNAALYSGVPYQHFLLAHRPKGYSWAHDQIVPEELERVSLQGEVL
jgi:hypothetical protein